MIPGIARRAYARARAGADPQSRAGRVVFVVSIALLTLSAVVARWSALNPESLWYDDLAWAALTRARDLAEMWRAPSHAPPGFLLLLRASRHIFQDPEWSMQLVPFVCGALAVPVMALVARRLTGSRGLAVLAAALTAINPLLAHYSVYVKQYSLDFLATAALLLVAAVYVAADRVVSAGRVAQLTLLAGGLLPFSVGSVFVSTPLVGVAALRSLVSKKRSVAVLLALAAFGLILVAGFFVFRGRSVELRAFHDHAYERSPLPKALWRFLSNEIRRVVEISLPSWSSTDPWAPETVSWPLPVVGLGLVWGLVRRSTRPIAWLAIGFFLAFLFATFEGFYTLTTDRRSIFTFPVFICLGVMGVHALTEWLPGREVLRLAIGLGTAAFALWAPIHVRYWPVTDVRLIQQTSPADADALVLTPAAVYLAAYYGPWPFTVERSTQVGGVRIMRSRTAVALDPDQVEHFVAAAHAGRVWFVSFRTADALEDGVVGILRAQGYEVEAVEHTTRGTLFVGSQP